jgi:hypothetical protein
MAGRAGFSFYQLPRASARGLRNQHQFGFSQKNSLANSAKAKIYEPFYPRAEARGN